MRWFLPILLLPWCAWADLDDGVQLDTVRCGRQVIQVGDRSWEILEACGEPDYREVIELRQDRLELEQPDGAGTVEVGVGTVRKVEEWVYLPSSGRLTRIMTLVSGTLTDIRLTGRN
ncbi:MAG: DUF2845 domain-containing protein [Pseudomonadota bacterium]